MLTPWKALKRREKWSRTNKCRPQWVQGTGLMVTSSMKPLQWTHWTRRFIDPRCSVMIDRCFTPNAAPARTTSPMNGSSPDAYSRELIVAVASTWWSRLINVGAEAACQ